MKNSVLLECIVGGILALLSPIFASPVIGVSLFFLGGGLFLDSVHRSDENGSVKPLGDDYSS